MERSLCLNYRVITANILGVLKFRTFTYGIDKNRTPNELAVTTLESGNYGRVMNPNNADSVDSDQIACLSEKVR